MKKYEKEMTEEEYKEFLKRYDQFKDCSLPCHFWDEERQTSEYVWFQGDRLKVETEIFEALGNVALTGLYYPFIDKHVKGQIVDGKGKWVTVIGHNHGHSFNDVVRALYHSPESFEIEKKDYKYYSKQELEYLSEVKKRLLLVGLKDHKEKYINNSKTRYKNKKQKKYENAFVWRMNDENIEKAINGDINFIIRDWHDYMSDEENESLDVLIIDKNGDFKLFVKVYKRKTILHKDIKNYTFKRKYKPNKKFAAFYFKVAEVLKKNNQQHEV